MGKYARVTVIQMGKYARVTVILVTVILSP
jgi:hypothetical protein